MELRNIELLAEDQSVSPIYRYYMHEVPELLMY